VGPDGDVLAEDHNTVASDGDISSHPELKLARWAARELDPSTAAATTMYTTVNPAACATGAIERSGLGRVVFALSNEQLANLKPAPAGRTCPKKARPCSTKRTSRSTALSLIHHAKQTSMRAWLIAAPRRTPRHPWAACGREAVEGAFVDSSRSIAATMNGILSAMVCPNNASDV